MFDLFFYIFSFPFFYVILVLLVCSFKYIADVLKYISESMHKIGQHVEKLNEERENV